MKTAILVLALAVAASAPARAESGLPSPKRSFGFAQAGIASVYDYGRLTTNGERFDPHAMTAAHRTLPFATIVKVCRVDRAGASRVGVAAASTGPCITVRINDRGPFVRGRIIDLTPAAAHALGFSGLAHVTVEPLGVYRPRRGDFGSF